MNTNLNKIGLSLLELRRSLGLAPPSHGYTIAEKAPEVVTAPGVYFPAKKGRVIPIKPMQGGGVVNPTLNPNNRDLTSYAPTPLIPRQRESVNPALTSPLSSFTPQSTVPSRDFGLREDGTPKGSGFLGVMQRPEGGVSSELSIGVNIDGKETQIPMLVPTLTEEEVNYLLGGGKPTDAIVAKAVEHAKTRMAQGLSPFAQEGEQTPVTAPTAAPIAPITPPAEAGGTPLPLIPKQDGGSVDPSLFKETFSVGGTEPTPQGLEAAKNTAMIQPTSFNLSTPPPAVNNPPLGVNQLQSAIPTPSAPTSSASDLSRLPSNWRSMGTYEFNKASEKAGLTGMAASEAASRERKLGGGETPFGTSQRKTASTFPPEGSLASYMPPPPQFKASRGSQLFESDQRTAFDKRWKPYQDFYNSLQGGNTPSGGTPLFSRALGGSTSPDPLEGLSEEERKNLLKLYGGHGQVATEGVPMGPTPAPMQKALTNYAPQTMSSRARYQSLSADSYAPWLLERHLYKIPPVETESSPTQVRTVEEALKSVQKPTATEAVKGEETALTPPVTAPTQPSLSGIGRKIIPETGATQFTMEGTQGAMIVPKGFEPGKPDLRSPEQIGMEKELEERRKWATPGYREARSAEAQKVSPLTVNPYTNRVSGALGVLSPYETTWEEAHPEEARAQRIYDMLRPSREGMAAAEEQTQLSRLMDIAKDPYKKRQARESAGAMAQEMVKSRGERQIRAGEEAAKSYSIEARAGKAGTSHIVQDASGRFHVITPTGTLGGQVTSVPTDVIGKTPPQDTSEWKLFRENAKKQGWDDTKVLDEWNKLQVERTGQKAKATLGAQMEAGRGMLNDQVKEDAYQYYKVRKQLPPEILRVGFGPAGQAKMAEIQNFIAQRQKEEGGTGSDRAVGESIYKGLQTEYTTTAKQKSSIMRYEAMLKQNTDALEQENLKVLRTRFPAINNLQLLFEQQAGDPDVAAFKTQLNRVAVEWAKISSGSLGMAEVSVQAQKNMDALLRASSNVDQLKSLIQTIRMDATHAVNSIHMREADQRKAMYAIAGKTPPTETPKYKKMKIRVGNMDIETLVDDEMAQTIGGVSVEGGKPRASDFGGNPTASSEGKKTIDGINYVKRNGDWYKE